MTCFSDTQTHHRRWRRCRFHLLLLAALSACVLATVQPRHIYDALGIYLPYPELSIDGRQLGQMVAQPGGAVQYLFALLSHCFYYVPAGATIIATIAWLIGLAVAVLIDRLGSTRCWFLACLPVLAVLMLYQWCQHPLAELLALAICLWALVIYQMLPLHDHAAYSMAAFLVIAAGTYLLAGAMAVLLGPLAGIWHLCRQDYDRPVDPAKGVSPSRRYRILLAGLCVVSSALIPWGLGTHLFSMPALDAYSLLWPFGSPMDSPITGRSLLLLQGLCLFPVVVCVVIAIGPRVWHFSATSAAAIAPTRPPSLRRRFCETPLQLLALVACVLVLFFGLPPSPFGPRFAMVHFTREQRWDDVLQAARRLPADRYDAYCAHLVNRALYHCGRLGEEMFSFPQHRSGLLLLTGDVPDSPPKFWMLAEAALDLGDINLAEQSAYESFENVGSCPWVLEKLALIYTIKERPQAARVFLNRMKRDLVRGRWAKRLLDALSTSPNSPVLWESAIKRARALRCTQDQVYQTNSEELLLERMLQANPHNKMACEYLMAFYLLNRQLDRFALTIDRLEDPGSNGLPRHYQEALLLYARTTNEQPIRHEQWISPEVRESFTRFGERAALLQRYSRISPREFANDFGDSYFFYYTFGQSGAKTP